MIEKDINYEKVVEVNEIFVEERIGMRKGWNMEKGDYLGKGYVYGKNKDKKGKVYSWGKNKYRKVKFVKWVKEKVGK